MANDRGPFSVVYFGVGDCWLQHCLELKANCVTLCRRSGLLSSGPSLVAKEPCTKVVLQQEGVRECVWSSVVVVLSFLLEGVFFALSQAQSIFY